MTTLIDLGKLRFSFSGDWSSSTTYETNDIVKYGGNVYVYTYGLKTSGHLPTETDFWALMVEGIKFKGAYATGTAYKVGDGVAHGGKVYIAIKDTTGNTPPNVTYWSQFADGIQYEGAYSNVAQYQRNDVVQYGASAYIAKQDTTGNLPTASAFWDKLVDGISATGVWSSVTAYVPGDLVAYGANIYKAIANNTNQLPIDSNGTLNSVNWQLFNSGIRSRGDWTTATEYYINDVVTRGGSTYICVVRNASTTFEADLAANKWQKFNSGIRWRGEWATGTSYLRDDVVKNSVGTAYIANSDHTAGADFTTDQTAGKWTAMVIGGADVLPVIQSGDNGQSLTVKADGSGIDWIGATASDKVFWVAPHGTDTATSGKNQSSPFASIKYACQQAPTGSTIFVKTGTYLEQLPIVVPANVAIVGDNQRTVIVQPKTGLSDDGITPNNQSTMFQMSNGSILNKMTFVGMTGWVPGTTAADVTTSTIKGVVVGFNPASPITHKSPYVLECAFIGSGAIGALIDGTVHATGAKTMIFHGYTVINDNGVGYWVKDGGKAEIVSCFTYYCYFGYTASGGGFIRALNGNNSYGTWGATSRGFDAGEAPIVGQLVGKQINFTYTGGNIAVGDTVTSSSGGTATVTNVQYSANKVYVKNDTGTFIAGNTLTFTSGGTGGVNAGGIENQKGFVLVAKGFSSLPKPGSSIQLTGDTYAYVIQSVSGSYVDANSELVLVLSQEKPTGSADGTIVTIRTKYSQIRLTGHDFLSIGTGGVATTNYPGTPTQPPAQGNETDEAYPGRVYYVSTDQDGNFRVGEYFRIDQATGRATLNANAFDLAGLTSLRLGSIGAQLGETINEFSSDVALSDSSNLAVPTENAVKTYVDSKVSNINLNSVVGPSSLSVQTGSALTQQYSVFTNTLIAPYTYSLSGTVPTGVTINASSALLTATSSVPAGTHTFNVVATGSAGGTVSKTVTLVVDAEVPLFSNSVMPTALTPSTAYTINAATATVGSGTLIYSVSSGSLPSGMSLDTSTGVLSGTAGASSTTPISYNFVITATNGVYSKTKTFSGSLYYFAVQGQALYGTNVGTGTFSWIAPTGVSSVSVVAVGGGANGPRSYNSSASGGSGGGLGWKNNIPVVSGQTYTVVVGAPGTNHSYGSSGLNGGNSYFIDLNTVAGRGGCHWSTGVTNGPNNNGYGGGWTGDGGGAGGNINSTYYPGGGAGGYSGNGGNQSSGGSGGGGGGGGNYSSTYGYSSGGGVGLLGQSNNGATGLSPWQPSGGSYGAGGAGSQFGPDNNVANNWSTNGTASNGEGTHGMYGENPWSSTGQASTNLQGGTYGGGGGGQGDSWPSAGGVGGQGGVRIIWGTGRSFPSTNTNNRTVQSL